MELLIRNEYRKVTAHLVGLFGPDDIDVIVRMVHEEIQHAILAWRVNGTPGEITDTLIENTTRSYLARTHYRRSSVCIDHHSIQNLLYSEVPAGIDVKPQSATIIDNQLRMLLACCSPGFSIDQQSILCLYLMCGFNFEQISQTLLLPQSEVIELYHKGLTRLRTNWAKDLPRPAKTTSRTRRMLRTISRLFHLSIKHCNSKTNLRDTICAECLQLAHLLTCKAQFNKPMVHALMALMNFRLARFEVSSLSDMELFGMAPLTPQRWNKSRLMTAWEHFRYSTDDNMQTEYHLEAGIIAQFAVAKNIDDTDWECILTYYDDLLKLKVRSSYILNRIMAYAQVYGACKALEELGKADVSRLKFNYLYYALQSDLQTKCGNTRAARLSLQKAIVLSGNDTDREQLQLKLDTIAV